MLAVVSGWFLFLAGFCFGQLRRLRPRAALNDDHIQLSENVGFPETAGGIHPVVESLMFKVFRVQRLPLGEEVFDALAWIFGSLHRPFVVCQIHVRVKAGSWTRSPPFRADSCAQMPTQVQLALVTALGQGSRSSRSALANSFTRCGCDPPCPPP